MWPLWVGSVLLLDASVKCVFVTGLVQGKNAVGARVLTSQALGLLYTINQFQECLIFSWPADKNNLFAYLRYLDLLPSRWLPSKTLVFLFYDPVWTIKILEDVHRSLRKRSKVYIPYQDRPDRLNSNPKLQQAQPYFSAESSSHLMI